MLAIGGIIGSEIVTLAADTSVEENVEPDVDVVDTLCRKSDVDCNVMLTTVEGSTDSVCVTPTVDNVDK